MSNDFPRMPSWLHADYKKNFPEMLFRQRLSLFREKLSEHMLIGKENDFFDLDTFNRVYVKNMDDVHKMVEIVEKELKELGWNTYLGFGNTGLYVYIGDELPSGVY